MTTTFTEFGETFSPNSVKVSSGILAKTGQRTWVSKGYILCLSALFPEQMLCHINSFQGLTRFRPLVVHMGVSFIKRVEGHPICEANQDVQIFSVKAKIIGFQKDQWHLKHCYLPKTVLNVFFPLGARVCYQRALRPPK